MPEPVPNVASISVNFTVNDHKASWLYNVYNTVEWTATSLEGLCSYFDSWVETDELPLMSRDVTFNGLHAVALYSSSGPFFDFSAAPGTVGTVAESAAPNNVTLSLEMQTGSRGRSYRGRKFLIGIPLSAIVGDTVTDTYISDQLVAHAALVTTLATSLDVLVIVSRFQGGIELPFPVVTPVTDFRFVDNLLDTKRKRIAP